MLLLDSDRLIVLDTTDPATIAEVDPNDAFFLGVVQVGRQHLKCSVVGPLLESESRR